MKPAKKVTSDSSQRTLKKNVFGKTQSGFFRVAGGTVEAVEAQAKNIVTNTFLRDQKSELSFLKDGSRLWMRGVTFAHLIEFCFRHSICEGVFWEMAHARVRTKEELRSAVELVPWKSYFEPGTTFSVGVDSVASKIFHEKMLKTELEQELRRLGLKVIKENADFELEIILKRDVLHVCVGMHGADLFKRGYKSTLEAKAPLRETLAALCCAKAFEFAKSQQKSVDFASKEFRETLSLLVPFCGSGTLAFEGMATLFDTCWNGAREFFALEKMRHTPEKTVGHLRKKCREEIAKLKAATHKIECIDTDEKVLAEARADLVKAFPTSQLTLNVGDFLLWEGAAQGSTFLPMNPPYGMRLKTKSDLYAKLGLKVARMKNVFGFVLAASEAEWKDFTKPLRSFSTSTFHITQGGLDIRVCLFASKEKARG